MSEIWRMFAAIDLTAEIRHRIIRTQQLLDDAGWKCRWVPENRMHLTVRFYGDLDTQTIDSLRNEFRTRLEGQPALELCVSRLGAFPNPNRPRVLWLGVDDPFEQLLELRDRIDDASAAAGIEPERGRFRPHLTVGRLARDFKVRQHEAVDAFKRFGSYDPLPFTPDHVNLVRSEFGKGGVHYTVVEQFALKA